MSSFEQLRHQPPAELDRPRELIVACVPMRSNVNLSQIARMAGCIAAERLICCGNARLIDKVARDSSVEFTVHRSLPPVLKRLREDGYRVVGLEQATRSVSLTSYAFVRRTVLVIGNERSGIDDATLAMLDDVVEIPVYGQPDSYNAAMSGVMGMYEYIRQFPAG